MSDQSHAREPTLPFPASPPAPPTPSSLPRPPTPTTNIPTATFYRRQLPSQTCIAFSSAEGRALFAEALAEGGMESYFPLSEHFVTQADPAFCGLGSLSMVLNALAIDPGRIWKGPWRWFDESLLHCCEPLEVVRQQGITLSKVHCLARCNGADSSIYYGQEVSLEQFRQAIIHATHTCTTTSSTETTREFLMVSYDRGTLGQTGSGHFSPLGGYHRTKDLVLVMDVARFKYPPHWVPLPLLYQAMQPVDPETGRSRGYLIVSKKGMGVDAVSFTIDIDRYIEWNDLRQWLRSSFRQLIKEDSSTSSLSTFLTSIPPSVASIITAYELTYSTEYMKALHQLVSSIEAHPTYTLLSQQEPSLLAPFVGQWSKKTCCRQLLNEKHVLMVIYLALIEWSQEEAEQKGGTEGKELSTTPTITTISSPTSADTAAGGTEDVMLQRETTQLKMKFQAMAQQD